MFAFVGLVAAFLLVVGFLGRFHPAFDAASLGRLMFFVLSAVCLFTFRSSILRFVTAVACGFALASMAVTVLPGSERPSDLSVYSKNLWAEALDTPALLADIEAADPDAVFLQYLEPENEALLTALSSKYPQQLVCLYDEDLGIAVLTRAPQDSDTQCAQSYSMVAARIDVSGQPLWLVSAHLSKPWPFDEPESDAAGDLLLRDLPGSKVIVGDFNAAGWSARVDRLAKLTETELAGPNLPTMILGFAPLPIDLALAPGGGRVERRGYFGSDHRGILVHLSLSK